MKLNRFLSALLVVSATWIASCDNEESAEAPVRTVEPSSDPLDQFIQTNWIDQYGVAVRYKFVDRYVEANKRVVPPKREVVEPMLNFLRTFWIEPYSSVPNGDAFFRAHVPAEIVFIGSPIYNADGTVTLGTADAGARITLTEVNFIDVNDQQWVLRQLGTIYHEFAHIIHQRYNLPPGWQEISPQGYTSLGSWFNLTETEALERGFVSPYGTSTFNEDYAELVAHLLFVPEFFEIYIDDEVCNGQAACIRRNEGRARLRRKYNAMLTHYKQYTGVDLLAVRAIIQDRLQ